MKRHAKTALIYLTIFSLIFWQAPSLTSQEVFVVTQLLPGTGPSGADLSPNKFLYGTASWYSESDPFINERTANGEIFDDTAKTCASWDYDFGTYLKITNLSTGRSVICRVNDRGPAKRLHRVIDLTQSAFRDIATLSLGLIEVSVEPLLS